MNVASLAERNVEKFGTYTQLWFEGREFTNVEMLEKAARFATALKDAGVKEGDRVGVMLPNLPEVGIAYGALLRMGAIVMPMVFLLAVPEIRHIIEDSEATIIITSPEFRPNVAAACEGIANPPRTIVVGDTTPEGCLSYAQMVESPAEPHPVVERGADDLAVIMYTSGTTGHPKGVMLTHGNLLFNAENSAKAVDLRDGDVSVQGLPQAHLFGLASSITGSLFKVKGILLRWFTAEAFFEAVNTHRANSSGVVPTMLTYMLSHPQFDDVDWSSMRWVVCGAAPLPVEVAAEFEKRTGARVLEGYGLTETSPTVSVMRIEEPSRPGSCGKPVPNVEVAILDDDDRPVPAGETGEVCVKGPNVMKGYYKLPDATAEVMRGGWFHTGDMGHLDEDGYLYITERKKDLIIRGGFNIYPRDIEEIIYGNPKVQECAVVGVPDPSMGEEVVAYVVLRPGESLTEDEVMSLCRENLAKYKTPKYVRFIDSLPKNPVGKIMKKDLRDRAKGEIPG
ncbi:MAG TPA: long-chain fatty acid--CoA ligase [Actinomycetota bacterium]|nr:long-chain fatty acid--CoA ligase [Actinomycetota bacterium]